MGKGKGIIIGLAGLAIGGALVGGAVYHFGNKKPVDTPNGGNSQVDIDEDYAMYELPAELKHLSLRIYSIGENYDLFTTESHEGVSYVLDKTSGEFKFLTNSGLSTVVVTEQGKFIALTDESVKVVDCAKMECKTLDLGSRWSAVTLKSTSQGPCVIMEVNDGNRKIVKLDKNFNIEFTATTTASIYNVNNLDVMTVEGGYLFYTWNVESYSQYCVFVDAETGESTAFNVSFRDRNSFLNKGNNVYFIDSNAYCLNRLNLETKTSVVIDGVYSGYDSKIVDCGDYMMVGSPNSVSTLYRVNYETNEVSEMDGAYSIVMLEDTAFFAKKEDNRVSLYAIGKENQELEKIYTFSNSSYDNNLKVDSKTIAGRTILSCGYFGGKTRGFSNVEVLEKEDGSFEFKEIKIDFYLGGEDLNEIAQGKYVYNIESYLYYVDLELEEGCRLRSSTGTRLESFEMNEDVLTYEMSDGGIYSFNITTGENVQVGVKA